MIDLLTESSAIFSDCGRYRWRLERSTGTPGATASITMVNPSKAGAAVNDHTIRKWLGFARVLKISRFIVTNKFAHVATDVDDLKAVADPVGPDNDRHIEEAMRAADLTIFAWGSLSKLPPHLRGRWRVVAKIAERIGRPAYCLGTAQDGQPLHPLTLGYDRPLMLWPKPPTPQLTER